MHAHPHMHAFIWFFKIHLVLDITYVVWGKLRSFTKMGAFSETMPITINLMCRYPVSKEVWAPPNPSQSFHWWPSGQLSMGCFMVKQGISPTWRAQTLPKGKYLIGQPHSYQENVIFKKNLNSTFISSFFPFHGILTKVFLFWYFHSFHL